MPLVLAREEEERIVCARLLMQSNHEPTQSEPRAGNSSSNPSCIHLMSIECVALWRMLGYCVENVILGNTFEPLYPEMLSSATLSGLCV